MGLTEELKELLHSQGAALVGIGDMGQVQNCDFRTGIAVAVPLPENIIMDLKTAPTKEYYDLYYSLNKKLNEIVMAGEKFLQSKGFEAYAQITDRVEVDQDNISKLPHKTVAARAGLGWIGKNCLLVTPEFGSAIRISSLLTDAPLACDAGYRVKMQRVQPVCQEMSRACIDRHFVESRNEKRRDRGCREVL